MEKVLKFLHWSSNPAVLPTSMLIGVTFITSPSGKDTLVSCERESRAWDVST